MMRRIERAGGRYALLIAGALLAGVAVWLAGAIRYGVTPKSPCRPWPLPAGPVPGQQQFSF
jgi:hypothetical protein